MPSLEAWEMQRHHERLMRVPRKTARDRNTRFKCECGNRVTKKQLKLHADHCIYCGREVRP